MATDVSVILDAVVTRVQALGLLYEGNPVAVRKRKSHKREESVDVVPHLDVYKSPRPETVEYFTNVWDSHRTFVVVEVVGTNDGDLLGDLDVWTAYRAAIVAAFAKRPADHMGIPQMRQLKCAPAAFLPPDRMERLYDLGLVEVSVETIETR